MALSIKTNGEEQGVAGTEGMTDNNRNASPLIVASMDLKDPVKV